MAGTILDGTDVVVACNLSGDDLILIVTKSGVRVFGAVLEDATKPMGEKELLSSSGANQDIVVKIGTPDNAVAKIGYRLGRVAGKLMKAAQDKANKT